MSPLAKPDRNKPGLCERFELWVDSRAISHRRLIEIALWLERSCVMHTPSWTILSFNEPCSWSRPKIRQKETTKHKLQTKHFASRLVSLYQKQNAHILTPTEFALPPTAGWGLGVDRLVMMLTDQYNIREVLTFPLMKDVKEGGHEERQDEHKEWLGLLWYFYRLMLLVVVEIFKLLSNRHLRSISSMSNHIACHLQLWVADRYKFQMP